jgi:single-stranded-DNA-specific exonuclease
MSNKKDLLWIYPQHNPSFLAKITQEFHISPVIAQILVSRGFQSLEEINDFLYGKLPNLYNPSLLADMDKAVRRILQAIEKKEAILIYGDNDVDGMSATALLTEFFQQIHAQVFFTIPARVTIKKTMIANALQFAVQNQCKLLITVDCGISAAEEIEEAVQYGIDVIITDHHEPTSKIPNCVATLNPKLIQSTYPNREITGVGVAFKLAHAVTNALIEQEKITPSSIDLKNYLDLVALGTISDMGALKGENRIFVRYGLKQMENGERKGLAKLFSLATPPLKALSPMDVASKVAPKLNSLGRIANPAKGVELLLSNQPEEIERLCQELDLNNLERQRIEKQGTEELQAICEKYPEKLQEKAIILASDQWHPGIIAILSAKLAKQYNRPTLILSIEHGIAKGSLRTIPEFPLLQVLKANEHLLLNFGGHDFAAGLTMKEENIPLFSKNFLIAADQLIPKDLIAKIYLDAEIKLKDLTFDFMDSLQLLEPFGHENPPPLLYAKVKQIRAPKVIGKHHLKLFLQQDDRILEGIAFGFAAREKELQERNLHLNVVFVPQINVFLNKSSIQLLIKDFEKTGK